MIKPQYFTIVKHVSFMWLNVRCERKEFPRNIQNKTKKPVTMVPEMLEPRIPNHRCKIEKG